MLWETLKDLTLINGVSGDEGDVRQYIINKIKPYAESIDIDTMGNVTALKKGTGKTCRKVMICAHMDEVGLIVSDVTSDGYIKFQEVGGIDDRILLAQRVVIGKDKVNGVIGIKAVHLQTKSERSNVIKMRDMYIDIGAKDKDDAFKYVNKGDYIAFNSRCRELGGDDTPTVKAKALDDRIGCAIMCELIKNEYKNDIYFCFNVQEEAGLRGAQVLSRKLKPDIAIVLESTTAADVPFTEPHEQATRQGEGPAVSIMDRASYADKKLKDFICDTAKKHKIKYQLKQTTFGGNDAGAIQTSGISVRVCSISMPCRYIHSPVSTVRKSDIDNGFKLADAVLTDIGEFSEE